MEIDEAKIVIRKNLERLRMERGWDMSDVAGRVGISIDRYRKLESGETQPRLSTLVRLVRAFEVDGSALFIK